MLVVDNSLLATNMYRLLFAGHPEWEVDYASDLGPITQLKKGGRTGSWQVVIINTGVVGRDPGLLLQTMQSRPALKNVPKIFLISPGQGALKDDLSRLPTATLVQKPFFPYDLIMQLNRIILQNNGQKKKPARR